MGCVVAQFDSGAEYSNKCMPRNKLSPKIFVGLGINVQECATGHHGQFRTQLVCLIMNRCKYLYLRFFSFGIS